MYFALNILGVLIVIGLVYLLSPRKKEIKWVPILLILVVEVLITAFMLGTEIGSWIINKIAAFFTWLMDCAYEGIAFVVPSLVKVESMDFFISVLLPIIFIVTFFDILSYFGIMTWLIDKLGWVISKVSRMPKLESFYSIQMMFLGNTEAIAVIRHQLAAISERRLLTIGIMSMSCISGSIIGAYITMLPPEYVFSAIPLNALNALLIVSLLNPVDIPKEEDIVYEPPKEEKKDFFSTISNSMMVGMNMVIVIAAMLIGYVALTAAVNGILGLFHHGLTIQQIFGYVLSPFALLLGLPMHDAMYAAGLMGTKLATNEFVAMVDLTGKMDSLAPHTLAVISVFLTSFANFSTIGMIYGAIQATISAEKSAIIGKNVWKLIVSGIAVSFLSAAMVGLFIW